MYTLARGVMVISGRTSIDYGNIHNDWKSLCARGKLVVLFNCLGADIVIVYKVESVKHAAQKDSGS